LPKICGGLMMEGFGTGERQERISDIDSGNIVPSGLAAWSAKRTARQNRRARHPDDQEGLTKILTQKYTYAEIRP
jgi:hypothetical protein